MSEEKLSNKAKKEYFDSIPVYFCSHCKSLYIETDQYGNDICNRCGSVNEIEMVSSIDKYLEKYSKLWGDEKHKNS